MTLRNLLISVSLAGLFSLGGEATAASHDRISFRRDPGRLLLLVDGKPMGTYVYENEKILRPYFMNLKAPGDIQVTRHCPPRAGLDDDDHASMHPGLWLAFGDVDGYDFWRNKERVKHVEFLEEPTAQGNEGSFAVLNHYIAQGRIVCEERCDISLRLLPEGHLILWESVFSSKEGEFAFGDQEEMGLGVRLATPIPVRLGKGGRIVDDRGRRNEKSVWGKVSLWCDYAGPVGDAFAGVMIMPSPRNFAPCRWHVRDYGFMAANPFAKKAFKAGPAARTVVAAGQSLSLRFGILLHSAKDEDALDLDKVYREYSKMESAR